MAARGCTVQYHGIVVTGIDGVVRNTRLFSNNGYDPVVEVGSLGLCETNEQVVAGFKCIEVFVIQLHLILPLVHTEDLQSMRFIAHT